MTRDSQSITFHGAAGTVTGSRHLIRRDGRSILLDCGLFQGLKALRQRNWKDVPFDLQELDAIALSHAHIDHTGYLPLVVRQGYRGPVYCTPGTADLLQFMLPDAAHLQEEQAAHANRHRYSRHDPALPLYTMEDAYAALRLVQPRPYDSSFAAADGIQVSFRRAGHILGSASVDVGLGTSSPRRVVFSGDLGRWDRPVLRDPETVSTADVVILESTYGDRDHPAEPDAELARIVRDTAEDGGALLIPAFAVGRTQELLWWIRQLEDDGRIPALPVYVDSPMAIDVTEVYLDHADDLDPEFHGTHSDGDHPLRPRYLTMARSVDASKAINDARGPVIVISASGMATGGRILHHMRRRLPDHRTTVLLVGYQAEGTRGRALQDGARSLRMFGQEVTVRARVATIDGLSAHADRGELMRWLRGFDHPPGHVYLVHGETRASTALRDRIHADLGWTVTVAKDGARVPLSGG